MKSYRYIPAQQLVSICFDSMEEGAAVQCKEAIEKALHQDQGNPEALQLMASYLFSIENNEVPSALRLGVQTRRLLFPQQLF